MNYTNLKEWKIKNNLNSTQAAEIFGITREYFQFLMSGKHTPSKTLAEKIHQITGIPILNLLYPKGA